MRCRWAAALIIGLMTAVTAVAPADAAATAEAPKVPAVDWNACGGPYRVRPRPVPLDHDDPGGAEDPDRPHPAPGERSGPPHRVPVPQPGRAGRLRRRHRAPAASRRRSGRPQVRARFDIVGFDPRGVARSTPRRVLRERRRGGAVLRRPAGSSRTRTSQVGPFIALPPATASSALRARPGRSSGTCPPPTWRGTSTCSAERSATTASTTTASPTARSSAAPTWPCSRTRSGRSCSTGWPTRWRGPRAGRRTAARSRGSSGSDRPRART